jgi:ElaB/YqjD/DUF883 family membrane-anchored ribosome-binding protein
MNEVTTRKFADDFKVLIDDIEDFVRVTANQAGERIGDLRQRLTKGIEDGKKGIAAHPWLKAASEAKAQTEACLRENTWTGLVVATGIGLIFGLLLRRK